MVCFDFFCVDVVLVLDVAFAWYAGCVEVFVYFLVSLVDDPKLRVFNREPAERATDQGGLRLAARFRSSAVLSAEVTPRSGDLGVGLTAGHRRRVTVLASRPLSDRGSGRILSEGQFHGVLCGERGYLSVFGRGVGRGNDVVSGCQVHPPWGR